MEIFCAFATIVVSGMIICMKKNMKNRRKPWRNHLDENHLGAAFLRDHPRVFPICRKSCPRPIVVAISLSTSEYGHEQRNQKTDDSEPCEHDIEESKDEIGGRYDLQVITPFLIFLFCHESI